MQKVDLGGGGRRVDLLLETGGKGFAATQYLQVCAGLATTSNGKVATYMVFVAIATIAAGSGKCGNYSHAHPNGCSLYVMCLCLLMVCFFCLMFVYVCCY